MTWPFDHLSREAYSVIVADPPWAFRHRSKRGQRKSAEHHYDTQPFEWIARLPVDDLAAPNCLLLLWATAPTLPNALAVMAAWGFRYKSRLAWRKVFASGKPAIGTGYLVRTMHEDCLIGVRGKPKLRKPFPSIFDGVRREHSRKPEEFYHLVADRTPNAHRCDLFTRSRRLGFFGSGDEADLFDRLAGARHGAHSDNQA